MPDTQGRCYYDNEACDYGDGLWQCKTCQEWYCYAHDHQTDKGHSIECAACERERKTEAEENE